MGEKLLNYIPKALKEDFVNNMVIPLVGAGFSKNADIPKDKTIPDWEELGKKITEYLDGYRYTNPLDILSLFENEYSRVKLIEIMARELHINEIKPSKTYEAFCDLFTDIICTTNFDFLIEETLESKSQPYSLIVSEDRLSISIPERTRVIKLHGDFNHPNRMIITEEDYDKYLNNNKILATYVSNLFITKTLFLVGYSFEDYDIRGIWQIVNDRLGKLNRLGYCVMVDANKTEISRFERRNIKVINLPGKKENYSEILYQLFKEIKMFIEEERIDRIETTNINTLEEFKLPVNKRKICYISAQFSNLNLYKEQLQMELQRYGMSTIYLDDININISENTIMSKIKMLINEASVGIIDITGVNNYVKWEYKLLKDNNKSVIIIAEKNIDVDSKFFSDVNIIFYDYNKVDQLIVKIIKEIEKITGDSQNHEISEARGLLNKNEYNAAVIIAYRSIEVLLRKKLNNKNNKKNNVENFLDIETMFKELNIEYDMEKFQKIRKIRNSIVHTNYSISEKNAEEIVLYAEEIIKKINK